MRYFSIVALCWLLTVAVAQANDPLDIEAFCASLRAPAPKVALVERKRYTLPVKASVTAVAMSGDLKRFVTTDLDGHLYVWNTKSGEVISQLKVEPQNAFRSVAMTSDGKFVLAGSTGLGGWVIDANTGKKVFGHDAPQGTVVQTVITKDDKWAVLITDQSTMHRYPLLGGRGLTASLQSETAGTMKQVGVSVDAMRGVVLTTKGDDLLVEHYTNLAAKPEQHVLPYPLESKDSLLIATKSYFVVATPGIVPRATTYPTKEDPTFHTRALDSKQMTARWAGITPDERWIMIASDDNTLEVRPTQMPVAGSLFTFATNQPQCVTMGADGRTFLVGSGDGEVHAFRLTGEPLQPIQRFGGVLQDLLARKRYIELEAIIARFERDAQPFAWAPNQSPYYSLGELLNKSLGRPDDRTDFNEQLDQWIARRPDASMPRIVRAQRYIAAAWEKRGNGVAAVVTKEGWEGFHANIAKAKELIAPMVEEQKPAPAAYGVMGIIAMAEGGSQERMKAFEDRVLEEAPLDIQAHGGFLQAKMPRWGGAPDDYHNYAARVADAVGGDAGDAIYTRLCINQIHYYKEQHFDSIARLAYKRFQRGLLHIAKTAPDQDWARHFGLRLSHLRMDKKSAREFAALIDTPELKNEWDLTWWEDRAAFERALAYGLDE